MRFNTRTVLVAVIAMLALSATTAAAASAATPEIVNKEGKALVKAKFTSAQHSSSYTVDAKGYLVFTCTGWSDSGEVTGLKTAHTTLALTGCGSWKSKGAKSGEVKAPEVSELLVYEVKGTELVPAILFSFPKELQYEGAGQKVSTKGSFLVPVKAPELAEKLSVAANQTGGAQEGSGEYEEASGGTIKKAALLTSDEGSDAFTEVQTGLGFEERLTFEEEFKINA
jgi:hypothetical protein